MNSSVILWELLVNITCWNVYCEEKLDIREGAGRRLDDIHSANVIQTGSNSDACGPDKDKLYIFILTFAVIYALQNGLWCVFYGCTRVDTCACRQIKQTYPYFHCKEKHSIFSIEIWKVLLSKIILPCDLLYYQWETLLRRRILFYFQELSHTPMS